MSHHNQRILILPTGLADPLDTCALLFMQAIHTAQERIWITSPYFVPDETVLSALLMAAIRGVDVRIMLLERPDHRLVYLARLSFIRETVSSRVVAEDELEKRPFPYRAAARAARLPAPIL